MSRIDLHDDPPPGRLRLCLTLGAGLAAVRRALPAPASLLQHGASCSNEQANTKCQPFLADDDNVPDFPMDGSGISKLRRPDPRQTNTRPTSPPSSPINALRASHRPPALI